MRSAAALLVLSLALTESTASTCSSGARLAQRCSSNAKALSKCLTTASTGWEKKGWGTPNSDTRKTYCNTKNARAVAQLTQCCTGRPGVQTISCTGECQTPNGLALTRCTAALQKVCDQAASNVNAGGRRLAVGPISEGGRQLQAGATSVCSNSSQRVQFYVDRLDDAWTTVGVQSFISRPPTNLGAALTTAAASVCRSESACPGLECISSGLGNYTVGEPAVPAGAVKMQPCNANSDYDKVFASVLNTLIVIPEKLNGDTPLAVFKIQGAINPALDDVMKNGAGVDFMDLLDWSLDIVMFDQIQFTYNKNSDGAPTFCEGGETESLDGSNYKLNYGGASKGNITANPLACQYRLGDLLTYTFIFTPPSAGAIGTDVNSSPFTLQATITAADDGPFYGSSVCAKVDLPKGTGF